VALKWAFEGLPEPWAYTTLLRCADELENTTVTLRVLKAVNNATEAVKQNWKPRDLARLKQLEQLQLPADTQAQANQPKPDADWLSWVLYVEGGRYREAPL